MTEKVPGLVDGLILKPGINGRRTYSKSAKLALVDLCKQSGASVAALALAHGINANLLRRWINQYGAGSGGTRPAPSEKRAALLPVTSYPSVPSPAAPEDRWIEISFKGATIRVRGVVDSQALGAVLDCLAQRA